MKAKVFQLNNNNSLSMIFNAIRVALNSFVAEKKQRIEIEIRNAKTKAQRREIAQNSINWHWCGLIAKEKKEETPNNIHIENKLDYGVPILARDKDFMITWQPFRYYTREAKLRVLKIIPITSIMTREQMTEYLSTFKQDKERELGITLTDKDDQFNLAMGRYEQTNNNTLR